jgi:signal transduction histidine kinase/ActR/RegA family two-component response regulator
MPHDPRAGGHCEQSPRALKILLLPPTSRDAEAMAKLFNRERFACDVCRTISEVCTRLSDDIGVLVLSEEALHTGSKELAACIAAQPVWSDWPIVVLSKSGAEVPALAAIMATLGNVSVLERPVRTTTLVSVVRTALRARERQLQVRDHLAARAQAETALVESRNQLELVVRGANVGVWQCPLPFDRLIWDETVKAHFHLPPDAEVTIDVFYERIHSDDRERVRQAIAESVAQRRPYDIDYRTVSPDGARIHWIRAMGVASFDSSGVPAHFSGITTDVTDRREAEEQRSALLEAERAARGEAERAGQMKDEFLATLSHELRTPLNAIMGWAQVLQMPSVSADDIAEGISIIERNARAQAQIIEDLLDMSRIISGKVRLQVQSVDLAQVIQAAVETVQPAAFAKGIRVGLMLDSEAAPITGDPNRLQQVFWNLISNAVKFTPRGGKVHVLLKRVNSHVEVSVHDNGEGIEPEFLPFVFDRFRQADATKSRVHGGLGLGLAIVRQLVELHGGTIRVHSEGRNCGSTFSVSLPVLAIQSNSTSETRRQPPTATAAPTLALPSARMDGVKVLVIDDERDARALIQRLLEECDAEVYTAENADEALDLVQSKKPHVLISDIGMPGQDGYSFIRRVRALSPDRGGATPAVALTAYARAEDRVTAIVAGFQHHLSKPVEPSELLAVVASLAGRTTGE